jgi:3-hydroxyacyl-CoA dehydrogenase
MKRRIEKVAVLGAGTMGARIAAHMANAGVPCFLLDIIPHELTPDEQKRGLIPSSPEVRNRIVHAGIETAQKTRPAAFFTPGASLWITIGNFEDNLDYCAQADWIIEAVAEDVEIKRRLLERVESHRRPGTYVTTNTSGLPVSLLAEGRSPDFQAHWAGTHFFNPPRYLRLVELTPGPATESEVLGVLNDFCDRTLGKGVVLAKDTPNFIANRIGAYSILVAFAAMQTLDMTIEEVDACTGPAIGQPKSSTFRTADIVGLDVLARVVRNIHDSIPNDESRDAYRLPEFLEEMLKRGWLGEKAGQGFYKRVRGSADKEILVLDWRALKYRPRQKARFASLDAGKFIEGTSERLRALVGPAMRGEGGDKASRFLWQILSSNCLYAARRIPEISDHLPDVDRAMRWGFGWELGPFQIWDALGVPAMAAALEKQGQPIPSLVTALLSSGRKSFYESSTGSTKCFDLAVRSSVPVPEPPGVISLRSLRERGAEILSNSGASLIDLGDGVLCCEFHTKMNAIGADIVTMLRAALKRLHSDFNAMVVSNQNVNFSVGANLMLILLSAREEEWDDIHDAVRQFQGMNMALKYAPKPVVVAPRGLGLGGGCEITLHGARIHAAAETYLGLVETGVGLIPAGGGAKEMLIRANEHAAGFDSLDLFHALKPVFETIAMAKVSTSAEEARSFGFLRPSDLISMNRDRLLLDAKETALAMVRAGYRAPAPAEIRVLGQEFLAGAKLLIHMMLRGEYITEYDAIIARKLASILAGGSLSAPQFVSEQYVLDLEREAFVSLCGQRKTQERIAHTLKTGKPLRN